MLRGRFMVARLARNARRSVMMHTRPGSRARGEQLPRSSAGGKSCSVGSAARSATTAAVPASTSVAAWLSGHPYKTWRLGFLAARNGLRHGRCRGTTRLTRSGLSMTDWRPQDVFLR